MRTAELIDDNAQQALELLIRYGTSSRTFKYPSKSASADPVQLLPPRTHSYSTALLRGYEKYHSMPS
jgi:hypothetical protein